MHHQRIDFRILKYFFLSLIKKIHFSSLGLMSYMAISGLTNVNNVTFVNFNQSKCGVRDYVIATNPSKYFDFKNFVFFSCLFVLM